MSGAGLRCRTTVLLLSALLLEACSSAPGERETGSNAASPTGNQACFFSSEGQNFEVLSSSALVIFAPTRSNAYLVRIGPPANELRAASAISFRSRSRSRRICGRAGETLLIGRDGRRRALVTDVRRLQDGELDEILSRYGKGEPGQGLEPRDTGSAEIHAIEITPDE